MWGTPGSKRCHLFWYYLSSDLFPACALQYPLNSPAPPHFSCCLGSFSWSQVVSSHSEQNPDLIRPSEMQWCVHLYLCPRLRCSFSCHFSELTSFPLWLMLFPHGYLHDCFYLVIQVFSKDVTCRFPLEWQSSGFDILFFNPQNTECLLHLVLPEGQGLQEGAIRPICFKTKCELYIWGALSSAQRNSCYCILLSDFANTLSQKYCKINLSLYITNMIIYS